MTERVANLPQFVSAVHTHSSNNTNVNVTVNLFRRSLEAIRSTRPSDQDIFGALETMNINVKSQAVGLCCVMCVHPCLTCLPLDTSCSTCPQEGTTPRNESAKQEHADCVHHVSSQCCSTTCGWQEFDAMFDKCQRLNEIRTLLAQDTWMQERQASISWICSTTYELDSAVPRRRVACS